MRIVFMGTPQFAADILAKVAAWEHGEVVGVFAQPDKPSGRGKALHAPETKILAQKLGIPVFQPSSFRHDPEAMAQLKALQPDILVVAAYGMILPQEALDAAPLGAYNVHASLLPKYRGAAPVQRSLLAGDTLTGVTIMRMEAGLDTGPMLLQQAVAIEDTDDAGALLSLLAEHGAVLMHGALNIIREQRATLIPQNDALSSYAPKLTKQEAVIDWTRSAREIFCHVRGFSPNPGATTTLFLEGKDPIAVRVEAGRQFNSADTTKNADAEAPLSAVSFAAGETGEVVAASDNAKQLSPALTHGMPVMQDTLAAQDKKKSSDAEENALSGTVLGVKDGAILVCCGDGIYGITRLRLAGKASIDAAAFKNGYLKSGIARFGAI